MERRGAKKNFNLPVMTHCLDMFPVVDTRDLAAVQAEVAAIFATLFPQAESAFIPQSFLWTDEWFTGRHPGYQAIDALYHDLEHTLQGTLCLARLLRGRHFAGEQPILTPKMFQLGLLAILMHDTGYLKRSDDQGGTGAKYTVTHVRRSGEFAREFLSAKGFSAAEIQAVQNMIRCTGVNVDLSTIPFGSELERIVGYALGTADLLAQMAAPDYVEKLPVLYAEFAEAVRHCGDGAPRAIAFTSAEQLMRNTPVFWEKYVWPKVNGDFRALYRYLTDPVLEGPNYYLDCIHANLTRLRDLFAAA
jgi:hypothetical protein